MTATHDRAGQVRTGASIEELQAAFQAAQRGAFSSARQAAPSRSPAQVGEASAYGAAQHCMFSTARHADPLPAQIREARSGTVFPGVAPGLDWRPSGRVVAVVAAHAGAGASTVAVAAAEALAETGTQVRIVEVADPSRSGLAAATSAELGEDGSGWRRGRRGAVTVDRLTERVGTIDAVPAPRPAATASAETVVLDIGWPARDAFAVDGWLATALAAASVLVVFRPTVPGVRQTEYLLVDLAVTAPSPITLAAVGPTRWPGAAAASAGPQLRSAQSSGRIVAVPLDRRVAVDGVSAEPLSKALSAAGRQVAAALLSAVSADQPASGRAG